MTLLPYNEELESRLLCCMMLGSEQVQTVIAAGVTDKFFYIPLHQAIFRALSFCAAAGESTDVVSTWRAMAGLYSPLASEVSEQDEQVRARVFAISFLEPTWLRLKPILGDVIALHRQRLLIKSLDQAKEEAAKNAQSWEDCIGRVEPHLTSAQRASEDFASRSNIEMIEGARQIIEHPEKGGIDGPFPSWDRLSHPLRKGQYIVLAGRPGSGKTALMLQYAGKVLRTGKDVAIFSLEMRGEELFERIGHQIARTAEPATALAAIVDVEQFKKLHIYESRDHSSLGQIEARCRLLASVYDLGFIAIDYLQLMNLPREGKDENRENRVASASRRLKLLAGIMPCPVMVLSQLNRSSEKRDDGKPRVSDLRESGAIEQDCDACWLLWKKDTETDVPADAERIEVRLTQGKRRNGPAGVFIPLQFNGPATLFTPIINV